MPTQGVRVLTIGKKWDLPGDYAVTHADKVANIMGLIAQVQPDVIVTSNFIPGVLAKSQFQIRKQWINVPVEASVDAVVTAIENTYTFNCYHEHPNEKANQLVSVYTPTYNTGDYLRQCYESIRAQTYSNWEWVVVDDMSEDDTWDRLVAMAREDVRVRPFRSGKRLKKVGHVKDLATRLSRGAYLVELDHDDMLVETCLEEVKKAFELHPDVGFVYSNSSCFYENGEFQQFPDPFWKDRYRWTTINGKRWLECVNPDIYNRFGPEFSQQFGWFLTVGPHHVRSFRARTLRELGGYNPNLPVADDWDLYARFFLRSKCFHIDRLLYLYRIRDNWENTTYVSNKSIQDHLAMGRVFYGQEFFNFNKKRLEADVPTPVDPDKPCFVVASREDADAQLIHEQLKGQDLYVAIGHTSIFDAYEAGRKHFAGRKRIIYVHNDVKFHDVAKFVELVTRLPQGLHGMVGSNDPEALEKFPWWERQELHGKWKQRHVDGQELVYTMGVSDKASDVRCLDGCLLVAINQSWDWKLRSKVNLWHAYDFMSCKKTIDSGGRCFTLPQPGEPILMHFGWGRMEGFHEAMKIVKTLMRLPSDRKDYPNVQRFLPEIEKAAKGNILQLGSRDGVSTDALLRGVEKNGGFVWSVDCDEAWKDAWVGHAQWKFIHAFSHEEEKVLAGGVPKELDVIFIDTEHPNETTKKELEIWGRRLKKDGVIIVHDGMRTFPKLTNVAEEYAAAHDMVAEFSDGGEANSSGMGTLRHKNQVAAAPKCPSGAKGQEGTPGLKPKPTTADVSYVIPVAKPTELLTRCVTSIRKWSPESEIIVVANGCAIPPHVESMVDKVVPLELNLRFGAGCNRGAMEATRDLLCILNDDAEFVDSTPARLVAEVQNHGGIVAPYSDRAKPPQGDIPRENTPKNSMFLDMVVGVCMMMPTALFRKLGGFDTRLDTYEDDDICTRARDRFGVKSQVVGSAWIKHERHNTFRGLGENVQAVMNRNGQIFRSKHPKIGVVAISKDEEHCIEGFFKQFLPVTNQFRLLDTGSRDGTLSAAERVGARTESAAFGNFSAARNLALERFGKEFDWVIMLDPDERLDEHTIKHIKELVFRTDQDIFLAPLHGVYPDGSHREFVAKPFLFRSIPQIYWVFKVHEKLIGSHRQALVKNALNEHILKFHEDGRRQQMGGFYENLSKQEPYFTDPAYREKMRAEWPILDYDRMDDPRLNHIFTGPLISVVIPTYKRRDLLVKAAHSVAKQDYPNIEIVVVGDACPDLNPSPLSDNRFRYINLPKNHGSGGAVPRNYGIMMAAGDLIAYLDDDNTWTPDHLSSLYEEMRKTNAAYAFSSMSVDGKDLKFDVPKPQGIDTSCVLHRKDLILKHGWWKDRVQAGYAHDAEFFSRWKDETWVCTRKPTVIYNADTSGQPEFIRALAAKANP